MRSPKFRISAIFAAILASVAVTPQQSLAEPDVKATFEIEIDGVKQTVTEGTPLTIELPAATKTPKLTVRRSAEQSYEFSSIRFSFDSALSLSDDHDTETRTVTLLNAEGYSIVISDLGPPDSTPLDLLVKTMTTELLKSFSTDPITEVKTAPASPHQAAKVGGMKSRIEYTDSDGDKNVSDVYVLRDTARDFSVTVSYLSTNADAAQKSAAVVLRTIASSGHSI